MFNKKKQKEFQFVSKMYSINRIFFFLVRRVVIENGGKKKIKLDFQWSNIEFEKERKIF